MNNIAKIIVGLLFVGAIGTFVAGAFWFLPPRSVPHMFVAHSYFRIAATLLGSGVIGMAVLVQK